MAVPNLLQSVPASDLMTYRYKRWTVHVTWDPLHEDFSYCKTENTLIISPFLRQDSMFRMRSIPLGSKGCRFDWPFYRAIEQMSNCSVYTGVWDLPHQPAAILFDLRSTGNEILDCCLKEFCSRNDMPTPTDIMIKWSIAFGFKVYELLKYHYTPSFAHYDVERLSNKLTRPVLQVQFHDWIAGPGLLFLRRHCYLDLVEFIFNVYQPVLGGKIPRKPGLAELGARQLGVYHKYMIEKNCALLADRVRCKGPFSGKLIKHQLGRGPDVFFLSPAEKEEEAEMRKSEKSVKRRLKEIALKEEQEAARLCELRNSQLSQALI